MKSELFSLGPGLPPLLPFLRDGPGWNYEPEPFLPGPRAAAPSAPAQGRACVYFAASITSHKTSEFELVQGVLHILQGNSSPLFVWDDNQCRFYVKTGMYVSHLSQTSLHDVLHQFLYAATCLRLVELVVERIEKEGKYFPTLRAFGSSVSSWLKRLRDIALKEDVKINDSDPRTVPTLLGMANSLSSLCSGAEFLLQMVREAVPKFWLDSQHSAPAAEVAVHILDQLYKKLNETCLVQGGEEEAYRMLLYLFLGSLLPYIEILDSWIFEGILDDPYNELFFYENKSVSINDTEFWEKSYLWRSLSHQKLDAEISSMALKQQACPLFIKDIAKEIVSAGKSLQLIRHVPMSSSMTSPSGGRYQDLGGFRSTCGVKNLSESHRGYSTVGLTLVELFFVSVAGMIGHGDHVYNYFMQNDLASMIPCLFRCEVEKQHLGEIESESSNMKCPRKAWVEFLDSTLQKRDASRQVKTMLPHCKRDVETGLVNEIQLLKSFCPENPVITVCKKLLNRNRDALETLTLSKNANLPPLNDEDLREAVFNIENKGSLLTKQTNFTFGFQHSESQLLRSIEETKVLEAMFPFPTVLPSYQEDLQMSELLPLQKNSTLPSRILRWIQIAEPKGSPLPTVILHECLKVYINKQVDIIGSHMLSKLLQDWRLMDELEVLRAIYLLGSGDLLQHFLLVIFNKMDKGELWDDDFELNIILQESIRNSADAMLLTAPDSLVVSIIKPHGLDGSDHQNANAIPSTPRRGHDNISGVNGLDVLNFTYKVSWPLELIANTEAIRKYNQVMHFLLKVKRAKFVLDKVRRWIWKKKGLVTVNFKHHWLVEQKLLHFVDAFHQYVMDRVYHSAWREMCQGIAAACSLDEVIEVHEAYLLSIQRQCFVVPDKLGALIASRINTILGLALDFYSIQQTLNSGGAISAIKTRCEMEVERIEKQFDDCIAFLLRVLSFKINVGHFPHLADLVTRINYNYYYMSDNGNMMTAPGSESVKLGKAFPSRPG
ncbi:gamma-tubulin complex component 5-like isoform X1 [Chenopodium quinoa]|uniref:gamma-tubulin complex component 5-like isoform X1 n=1 Tax=Chenopodium quinoa TaxID=63459 RepID=UPI000B779E57|nr:gamma-tubulin complex component 5-like isoform X1 [Chenopodium quinoa]